MKLRRAVQPAEQLSEFLLESPGVVWTHLGTLEQASRDKLTHRLRHGFWHPVRHWISARQVNQAARGQEQIGCWACGLLLQHFSWIPILVPRRNGFDSVAT